MYDSYSFMYAIISTASAASEGSCACPTPSTEFAISTRSLPFGCFNDLTPLYEVPPKHHLAMSSAGLVV